MCIYIYMYVCMYVCIYIYMCVCTACVANKALGQDKRGCDKTAESLKTGMHNMSKSRLVALSAERDGGGEEKRKRERNNREIDRGR